MKVFSNSSQSSQRRKLSKREVEQEEQEEMEFEEMCTPSTNMKKMSKAEMKAVMREAQKQEQWAELHPRQKHKASINSRKSPHFLT